MAEAKKTELVRPAKTKLQLAQAGINKKYGQGSIMQGRGLISNVRSWSTEIASLDIAIGCGGLPEGRIIEVFGPESAGKTTTTLHFVAACQNHKFGNKQGVAAFVDVEHALDPEWATRLGVRMDDLIFAQPTSGEEALDIVLTLVETGEVNLVVIDSVAALTPQAELDGDIGDANIGAQARLMSRAMRKLTGACSRTGTVVVFINQIREKIGVIYGSNETTPGGRALKFFSSVRIEVRRAGEQIKDKTQAIGYPTKAKIVKNKVSPPFVTAYYNIMFGISGYDSGVDRVESLVTAAVSSGAIKNDGNSWYTFNGVRLNGIAKLKAYIHDHPELVPEIREKTYEIVLASRSVPIIDLTDEQLAGEEPDDEDSPDREDSPGEVPTDRVDQESDRDDD